LAANSLLSSWQGWQDGAPSRLVFRGEGMGCSFLKLAGVRPPISNGSRRYQGPNGLIIGKEKGISRQYNYPAYACQRRATTGVTRRAGSTVGVHKVGKQGIHVEALD
jgi:hypothetical protein